jgi:Ser/Thr protein kinase RdoA (MazF antagonist)
MQLMQPVAICMSYILLLFHTELGTSAPETALRTLLTSYNSVLPLTEAEQSLLPVLIQSRYVSYLSLSLLLLLLLLPSRLTLVQTGYFGRSVLPRFPSRSH